MYKVFRVKLRNSELNAFEKVIGEFKSSIDDEISLEFFNELQTLEESNSHEMDMIDKMDGLFPLDEYDVFISHSHNDLKQARQLKKYLETCLGLKVFIDSDIWANANTFLRNLDNKYCLNSDSKTYNYDKRNISTTHVHMMLAASLLKIIDKSECMLLFETDSYASEKKEDIMEMKSAWIYYEYLISQHIMPSIVKRKQKMLDEAIKFEDQKNFAPFYRVSFKNIPLLDFLKLRELHNTKLVKKEYLDKLYLIAKK